MITHYKMLVKGFLQDFSIKLAKLRKYFVNTTIFNKKLE